MADRGRQELDLKCTDPTGNFAATALIAHVSAPDPIGSVLFVNYLPTWKRGLEYEREIQAVTTIEAIERHPHRQRSHVVITGDLDADPAAASIRFLTGHQSLGGTSTCYIDGWDSRHPGEQGATQSPENPLTRRRGPRRIDYILVRCKDDGTPTLGIHRCDRILHEPVNGHGPVTTTASWPTCMRLEMNDDFTPAVQIV